MKIDFVEITSNDNLIITSDTGWFPSDEFTLTSEIVTKVKVRSISETRATLNGGLKCTLTFDCDYCCTPITLVIDRDFEYLVKNEEDSSHGEQEKECSCEDLNTLYLEASIFDVGDILLEQLYLAIPETRRCKNTCKGLCPRCGIDRNNKSGCDCENNTVNSPFAILQKMKK